MDDALAGQDLRTASFLGLLRRLSALDRDVPPVGLSHSPRRERYRIGQCASLAFAPREIARLRDDAGRTAIDVFGLGLLGPNGPMPLHFTEMVHERTEIERDRATTDFLDLFHHRALALFYRAWAGAQATAELDRAEAEGFSRYPAALAGDDPAFIAQRALPPHALLAAVGHRAGQVRTASGLGATLGNFFGMPVAVRMFAPEWLPISARDRNRLDASSGHPEAVPHKDDAIRQDSETWNHGDAKPHDRSRLGRGVLLGSHVPDRQHHFHLRLGPMGFSTYLHFTPGGTLARQLAEWVEHFVGDGLTWDASLWVDGKDVVPWSLGMSARLGHAAWLGTSRIDGMLAGVRIASNRLPAGPGWAEASARS